MSFIPRPQEIYKHFKGNLYQIVAIAEHSETGEQLVIYQALYGDFKTYARPLSMFVDRVDREKYPDVLQEFRFELQGQGADRQKAESGQEDAKNVHDKEEAASDEAKTASPQRKLRAEEKVDEKTDEKPDTQIDPLVIEFLDADSYVQKLNILAALHHRITDSMINTMAVASDVEVEDGDVEKRYDSLRRCLLMKEKYECNRLRE